MSNVVVIGGLLQDITFNVSKWPAPEEVVYVDSSTVMAPGGKGLNNAIGISRLGQEPHLIGCVGEDFLGDHVISYLTQQGVSTKDVIQKQGESTGVVAIMLEQGVPRFISSPGASVQIKIEELEIALGKIITTNTIVLVNYEIEHNTAQPIVSRSLEIAKASGAIVVLNPAPVKELDVNLTYWQYVDFLIPNIEEARTIVRDNNATDHELVNMLLAKGIRAVCLTNGDKGSLYASESDLIQMDAVKGIDFVSPIGASDAFCAAFVVGLHEGMPIRGCLQFATASAALACTRPGAYMPFRSEVDNLLASYST